MKKYAEPLVDDIESVINKLIDEKESKATASPFASVKNFGGGPVPNLTFTKMLSAQINGKLLPK